MNKLSKIVSFFLKCQGCKNFSVSERNNTLYVSCNERTDALTQLFDFLKYDYNPHHNNNVSVTNKNDLLLLITTR